MERERTLAVSFTTEKFHLDRDTNVRAGESLPVKPRGGFLHPASQCQRVLKPSHQMGGRGVSVVKCDTG